MNNEQSFNRAACKPLPSSENYCSDNGAVTIDAITCTKCHKSKPADSFHKNANHANGRDSQCKECISKRKSKKRQDKKRLKLLKKRRKCNTVLNIEDFILHEQFTPNVDLKREILEQFLEQVLC